jgi:hypothetical protein
MPITSPAQGRRTFRATWRLRAGDSEMDPARSGLYFRYRLEAAYALEVEHLTVDQLLASRLSEHEMLEEVLVGVPAFRTPGSGAQPAPNRP